MGAFWMQVGQWLGFKVGRWELGNVAVARNVQVVNLQQMCVVSSG